jgi:hypothetical protein
MHHFVCLQSVKCNLRYLESFKGSKAIAEASIMCPASTKMYGMIVKDTEARGESSIPTLELYKNHREAVRRKRSYNFDLLQAMMVWNGGLPFKKVLYQFTIQKP